MAAPPMRLLEGVDVVPARQRCADRVESAQEHVAVTFGLN